MCIFTRRDNFYVHAVSWMLPKTQFSCDITDSGYILGFQKQISSSKTLKYKYFTQWIYESSSELIEWQSPQTQYMCTHPRKQNQTLCKNHLFLLNICGSLYQTMTSVPDHDPAPDPPTPLIPWKIKASAGTVLYISIRLTTWKKHNFLLD